MIANDQGEEAESKPGFQNGQDFAKRPQGREISVAERKKGVAAEIAVGNRRLPGDGGGERRVQRPVQKGKADDQPEGPGPEHHEHRQGPEKTEKGLAEPRRGNESREPRQIRQLPW